MDEHDLDYNEEIHDLMAKWGDKYVRWLKLDQTGKYPFIAVDEPDIVDIKGKAVMRVPVAYDRQMRYIGFGESDNPMSCYVGMIAVGYYDGGITGFDFSVVVEEEKDIIYKFIPETEPYVNRLIEESAELSPQIVNQLLEGRNNK